MLYIEPGGGLANRMRTLVSAMELQRKTGVEIVCIWNERAELNAPFNKLFEDISGVKIISPTPKYRYLKSIYQKNFVLRLLAKLINKFLGFDYVILEKFLKIKNINMLDMLKNNINSNFYIRSCDEFTSWNYDSYQKFKPIKEIEEKIVDTYKLLSNNNWFAHKTNRPI